MYRNYVERRDIHRKNIRKGEREGGRKGGRKEGRKGGKERKKRDADEIKEGISCKKF